MINLVPPQGKKTIMTEYYLRVVVVGLTLFFLAGVILLALSLPVLVLIKSQLDVYRDSYSAAEAKTDSYIASTAVVAQANMYAAELSRLGGQPPMLPLFDIVRELAGTTISIDTIDIKRAASGQIEQFTISGEAATRADLAAFRNSIESQSVFTAAELPLSNLAKDKEVPYTITITIAPPIVN